MQLIQIVAPFMVCGVVVSNGRVVQAAPIVKYMRGWTVQRVLDYAFSRNWLTQELPG